MAAADIEAMNRVRIAMGVEPLPVPGAESSGPVFKDSNENGEDAEEGPSTVNSRQAAAGDNWAKLEAKQQAEFERQARKEKLRKERERAQLNSKLEGKGLGEVENDDLDTKSWLMQQKKRQKKIDKARKLQEELAERERLAEEEEYTGADLAGVRVGHELAQFDEGSEQILTLKDNAVDDSDVEDELEASNLRDKERLAERLESKKRKRAYDPNEVNEDGEQSILAQYDEDGKSRKNKKFTLDGLGSTVEATRTLDDGTTRAKGITISLDILNDVTGPISDYAEPVEVKIKKAKKKKTKHARKKAVDEDDIVPIKEERLSPGPDSMDIDGSKKLRSNDSIFDDDDLQAKLAQQRRQVLKKRKKVRPEDLVKQIREEASATPDVMNTVEDGDEEEPGLIIDETSRFVSNLEKPDTPPPEVKGRATSTGSIDAQGDVNMEVQDNAEKEEPKVAPRERSVSPEGGVAGLDNEQTVGQGLGATLALLKQRSLVADNHGEELNRSHRERQAFLQHKQRAGEDAEKRAKQQRDAERQSGRLDHMSAKDREERARHANSTRDHQESRKLADIFSKEYRPNVELRYHDDHGRSLDQKEAFKHLSHQFHGKGSGKGKTEKRLKQIENEKQRMSQSSLDSSHHIARTMNPADRPA